jgi:uncharacterized protein
MATPSSDRRLRCVVDTNVLISAALFADSQPGRALRLVLRRGTLLASPETLAELAEVLGRRKLDGYLAWKNRFVTNATDECLDPASERV